MFEKQFSLLCHIVFYQVNIFGKTLTKSERKPTKRNTFFQIEGGEILAWWEIMDSKVAINQLQRNPEEKILEQLRKNRDK